MRLKELNPDKYIESAADWEEVPDEDLWQDGEIKKYNMPKELFEKIIIRGDWKIIRKIEWPDDEDDDGRDREWEDMNL